MLDSAEIKALVSLLADEDPKIAGMIWEHLTRLGPAALPALREASEASDPRLRARARYSLAQLSLDEVERTLQGMASVEETEFDLEAAFCALARIADPEVSPQEVAWALDDIASKVEPKLRRLEHAMERVGALTQVFHGELKFSGVLPDWNDLDPACIHRVLERRAGIPIVLSAIYLLVGKRLRLPLVGVSLPHHFLVKYAGGTQEIFIDPFYGGQIFTRRECVQSYLRDYYPKDAYIHQAGSREITIRALRGLILLYAKRQDRGRVRRLTRFLEILQVRERTR